MKQRPITEYLLYTVLGLFLVLIILFFFSVQRYNNVVYRNVIFAEKDISGYSQEEFNQYLTQIKDRIYEKEFFVTYGSSRAEVGAEDLGLSFDAEKLWSTIYQYGHTGSIGKKFSVWLHSFGEPKIFTLEVLADKETLESYLNQWEEKTPSVEPYNGSIHINGMDVLIDTPQSGLKLNREELSSIIIDAFMNAEDGTVLKAPLTLIEPKRSLESYREVKAQVEHIMNDPIILRSSRYPEPSLQLSPEDIAKILFIEVPEDTEESIKVRVDREIFTDMLTPLHPQQAEFNLNPDNTVTLIPGKPGFDVDVPATASEILALTQRSDNRMVDLKFDDYLKPDFTTSDAEDLGIEHLVSQFTTYHSCCQKRVENIHLVADIIDGTYLLPEEEFNMNEFVGERTEERGFKKAGTIIKGHLEDTFGGGISQFVTTFHNAVYWGGYEVVTHKPHSIYFSRYPIGIEATINWPYVDYIFRNDTDTALYINTSYTDTSITVSFLGSNDGRIVVGDHSGGETHIDVTKGGAHARTVWSVVSPQYNIREPMIEYKADLSLERGEEVVESVGLPRWSVSVMRTVYQDDTILHEDFWPVHYRQDNTIVRKHPCDFYNEEFDYSSC